MVFNKFLCHQTQISFMCDWCATFVAVNSIEILKILNNFFDKLKEI